jgi:hypothetical protein
MMIENMLMFYDEVRERLQELGILTTAEVEDQKRLLRELSCEALPPAWGTYRIACET